MRCKVIEIVEWYWWDSILWDIYIQLVLFIIDDT
jgi:hypothetical protein